MLTGIIEHMSEHKTGLFGHFEAASCMASLSKTKSKPAGKFKEIIIMCWDETNNFQLNTIFYEDVTNYMFYVFKHSSLNDLALIFVIILSCVSVYNGWFRYSIGKGLNLD